jgi:putative phage-type endonuclease
MMAQFLEILKMIEQLTSEWHAKRKGRVTGSIAGALLGMSPYMSVKEAMAKLRGEPAKEQVNNHILEYGRHVESTVRGMFETETGLTIRPCGFYEYDDWLGASPDGIVVDDGGEVVGVLEVKCPWGLRNDENPRFKKLYEMPHYHAQVQMEMLCAGVDTVYFYQYANGHTALEVICIDHLWLDRYIPKLREIWESIYVGDHPAQTLIDRYFETVAEIDRLAEEKVRLLQEVIAAAGDEPGAIGDARLIRTERAGSVSYAKVVKEHLPDLDLSPYRGDPSVTWSLKR